jgi:hypothetical protein
MYGGHHRDTHIDRALRRSHVNGAILRQTMLRHVHGRKNLDPSDNGRQ